MMRLKLCLNPYYTGIDLHLFRRIDNSDVFHVLILIILE